MWRNYLTVGIRALAKNRAYTAINVSGLALGIAACLLILGFVRYEFSYNDWLPDVDKTFQFQNYFHPTEAGLALGSDWESRNRVIAETRSRRRRR